MKEYALEQRLTAFAKFELVASLFYKLRSILIFVAKHGPRGQLFVSLFHELPPLARVVPHPQKYTPKVLLCWLFLKRLLLSVPSCLSNEQFYRVST